MPDTLSKLQKLQAATRELLSEHPEQEEQQRLRKFARFWVLVGRSFVRNRCPVRASALAYATLLALVPMLALVLSVTSSMLKQKGESQIEELIDKAIAYITPETTRKGASTPTVENLPESERAAASRKEVATRIKSFINNMKSGTLGVAGMIGLIAVGIGMLIRIEDTLNDIWGVSFGRSWLARIVQYWATLTLGPLLLAGALALPTGKRFQSTQQLITNTPVIGGVIGNFILTIAPFLVLTVAFTGFYKLMPNTQVKWRAAFVGGAVGGTLWTLNNYFSVYYVSRVSTDSAVYGGLAAVPLFMIGLYFSWIILLFGAQVAYSFQNRRAYMLERQVENINQRGREFVSLRLMTFIAQQFAHGRKPPTANEIAEALTVPTRLISQLVAPLIKNGLLLEVSGEETAYTPGRPIESISFEDVLIAMRAGQGNELETRDDPAREVVRRELDAIQKAERTVAGEVTLGKLANPARA